MEFDSNLLLFKDKIKTTEDAPHLFSDAYLNQISSPSYLEQVTAEIKAEEAQAARASAIRHQNISIMALVGQEVTVTDLETKFFWETDPLPNIESRLLFSIFNPTGGRASLFGGESKLWQYLSETAKEISIETNCAINIYDLTPTEAIFLIKELIRRRLNYDDVIAKNVTQEKIDNNKVTTAIPNTLTHFSKNPSKYTSQSNRYISRIDVKKTDQIIKHGYAVCRHVAAVSSVLYEVIRSKQQNILMNGSYLIYHDERIGEQSSKASVDMHAYNVLYTTRPTKASLEANLSVIDPTFIMGSSYINSDPDQTSERVSQACSSLYEYGDFFGLSKSKDAAKHLSLLALNRIKKSPEPKVDFNDYVSLEYQSVAGDSIKALNATFSYLVQCGNSPAFILSELLQNPPVSYENKFYKHSLRKKWLPGIIDQINKLRLDPNTPGENKVLLDLLSEHVTQITTDQLLKDSTGNLWKLLEAYQNLSNRLPY